MAMTLEDARAQLKSLGNEKVRAQNKKHGAGDNQSGVLLHDMLSHPKLDAPNPHRASVKKEVRPNIQTPASTSLNIS